MPEVVVPGELSAGVGDAGFALLFVPSLEANSKDTFQSLALVPPLSTITASRSGGPVASFEHRE